MVWWEIGTVSTVKLRRKALLFALEFYVFSSFLQKGKDQISTCSSSSIRIECAEVRSEVQKLVSSSVSRPCLNQNI
jgi:hypothetical protein